MASMEQKMAAGMSGGLMAKAGELKSRLLFVLGALIVYRIGTYIPLPSIDTAAMDFGSEGGILAMFNMFSGGALGRMTIFSLNVFPYITASIIIQLMTVMSANLANLKKEGESGRRIITQYTRYLTILISMLQGMAFALLLERMPGVVEEPGVLFRLTIMITITGGVMFLMWLGDQISSRGIGNGMSIIIAAGILAEFPGALIQLFKSASVGAVSTPLLLGILAAIILLALLIILVERAYRKVLIQYPKRQISSTRMTGGESSHLPLKLNTAGVIPAIFASALLGFPITLAGFAGDSDSGFLQFISLYLSQGKPAYIGIYAFLIIFFCFFYTAVVFNPTETADNLKRNGGFIPGIRPGEKTSEYLDFILSRLTVVGAIYLTFVCVVPEIFIGHFQVPMPIGGTGLLIVINVILDTVQKIQTYLISHQYEGLMEKAALRKGGGGRGGGRGGRRRR